ncbi:MAG: DNA-directed RNA polymerase subunit beta [Candidatus Gracilibacteria bacterium]|nr:DNA-directed RNA polymerase subunit beta [Candidatus Gracilibacteria bacterium]
MSQITQRRFFTTTKGEALLPNLIEIQTDSYNWFLNEGIAELLDEISPIEDFTGKNLELHFIKHYVDEEKYDEITAREKNISYEAPLRCQVQLINKVTGEVKEQEVFLGNIPLMTPRGTFIINGVERVVVSQIVRSPGVVFVQDNTTGYFGTKLIPNRGAWLEMETDKRGIISVKIDRKRKLPVTSLLRAFGYGTDKEIIDLYKDLEEEGFPNPFLLATLEKDPSSSVEEGLQAVYKRIRPGDLATAENAKQLLNSMFFDFRRYDLGKVGRYKINKRLHLDTPLNKKFRVLQREDLVAIISEMIRLNTVGGVPDDIDHLGNRRIRAVGELCQNKFRVGLLRTERICKDRMTVLDLETVVPTQLINSRPIIAAMREFFASSQLSQFMDQTNPLSELDHKRRLSAMGPGGLARERASFDVRDVHRTHYGRICPITTPEGPNIGLVVHLATYAKVNEFGFIETPYIKVDRKVSCKDEKMLIGRYVDEDIKDPQTKKVLVKDHTQITPELAKKLVKIKGLDEIPVRAYVTDQVDYYDADEEMHFIVAPSNTSLDQYGNFMEERVSARKDGEAALYHIKDVTHVDVDAKQIVSVSTSLIPFLEHDDGSRALMGSNMQRQAVSLMKPEAPVVGTGMEKMAAVNSRQVIVAEESGVVADVEASQITMISDSGKKYVYKLQNFARSNQATCMHQRPIVEQGEKIKKGQVLADGAATQNGEIALGRNLLVAYMSWFGGNYEDAILISERMLHEDYYSSIHIENYVVDVRDTKLGPETVTRDIPNISEEKLKNLDEEGIVVIGSEVNEGDILVGKITPKGETELTAEERLLRAIFGEKARDVKDTSLRIPGGAKGKVVGVRIFDRAQGDDLPTGVNKQVQVSVAQVKQLSVGDKLAGRHGNKGVISKVVPLEDLPFLADGTPVDIVLNPLGIASRMNVGQLLEAHIGRAAKELGIKIATPVLNGITEDEIRQTFKEAGLPEDGKVQLYEGKTGEPFDNRTTVGYTYIMKLHHLVDDKIHARSIGPYSLVTQQPLGGKAQHGGQRFGEMEVWALEAYAAAHALQEMLTIKSDDVLGRSKAYESIVKGEEIKKPRTPESFNVLVRELQGLCLNVDLTKTSEIVPESSEDFYDPTKELEAAEKIPVREEPKEDSKKKG